MTNLESTKELMVDLARRCSKEARKEDDFTPSFVRGYYKGQRGAYMHCARMVKGLEGGVKASLS